MFVTGPNVVKTVTHEEVSSEELGGAGTHATKSGVTQFTYPNEIALIEGLKKLLSYVPQNCDEEPPSLPYTAGDELRMGLQHIIPESANQPYDMKEVIGEIVDTDSFFEVHKDFAENIVESRRRRARIATTTGRRRRRRRRAGRRRATTTTRATRTRTTTVDARTRDDGRRGVARRRARERIGAGANGRMSV